MVKDVITNFILLGAANMQRCGPYELTLVFYVLSHDVACFKYNITITNFFISHTCNVT